MSENGNGRKLDDPETVKWILRVFYVICAVLFVMDFIIHRHVSHEMESIPGFYAIYGFVGCVVLVVVARWMRVLLMRDEDYYEDKPKNKDINQDYNQNYNQDALKDRNEPDPVKEAHHVDR